MSEADKASGAGGRHSRAAILEGDVGPTLLRVAWPIAGQSLVGECQGLFSNFWIGRLIGVDGFAVMAVWTPMYTALAFISGIIPLGVQVLTARSTGRQDGQAIPIIVNGGYLAAAWGIVIAVIGLVFIGPITSMLAGNLGIAHSLESYLIPLLVSYVVPSVTGVALFAIGATGWTRFGLIQSFVSIGFMLALMPIFVGVFHLGLAGLTISDACADTVLFALCGFALYRFRNDLELGAWRRTDWRLEVPLWGRIANAGVSYQLAMGMNFIAQAVLIRVIMRSGDKAAVAGYGVSQFLIGLAASVIGCIGVGAGIMIGQNAGARKPQRAVATLRVAATWVGGFAVVMVVLAGFCAPAVGILTDDPKVIDQAVLTANALKWAMPAAMLSALLLRTYTSVSPNKLGNILSVVVALLSIAIALSWPGEPREAVAAAIISTHYLRLVLLVFLYRRCFATVLERRARETAT
jgi:Na+-driven multidrug efflux pump